MNIKDFDYVANGEAKAHCHLAGLRHDVIIRLLLPIPCFGRATVEQTDGQTDRRLALRCHSPRISWYEHCPCLVRYTIRYERRV